MDTFYIGSETLADVDLFTDLASPSGVRESRVYNCPLQFNECFLV
jgi:hypothetical protein